MSTSPTSLQTPVRDTSDRGQLECFLRNQDEQAFRTIVERHSDMVWGVCRRSGLSEDESEDVFQATFFVLARNARRIRRRNSLASWIYGVACRTAFRALSERGRHPAQLPVEDATIDENNPLHEVARRDEFRLIDEELNRLPERYRTPLVLLFLQGRTNSEVARELGISVGAVDGRIRRGKEQLRLRLMMRGVSLAALWGVFQQSSVAAAPSSAFVTKVASTSLAGANLAPNPSATLTTRTVHLVEKELTRMTISLPLASSLVVSAGLLAGMIGLGVQGSGGVGDGNGDGAGDGGDVLLTVQAEGGTAPKPARQSAATIQVTPQTPPLTQQTLGKLSKPVSLHATGLPLKDILKRIGDTTDVEVWIDEKSLEDVGVDISMPVTLSLNQLPADLVLDEVLPPRELDWRIEESVLIISSLEDSEEQLITRVFNVEQLLAIGDRYYQPRPANQGFGSGMGGGLGGGNMGGGGFFQINDHPTVLKQFGTEGFGGGGGGGFGMGMAPAEPKRGDWLIDFLQEHTMGTWMQIDGTGGELSLVGNLLIVRQTFRVMRSVQWHLDSLSKVLTDKNATIEVDSRSKSYPVEADKNTLKKLHKRTSLKYDGVSLGQVLADVAKKAEVDLLISPRVEEDSVGLDTAVSMQFHNGSYDLFLKLLLKRYDLDHYVSNGVLNVTTLDDTDSIVRTVVFRVLDFHMAGFTENDLMNAIHNSTTGPWESIDGSGGRLGAPLKTLISVTQNERNLGEIRSLLASMRRHVVTGTGMESEMMSSEGFEGGFGSEATADATLITRFYKLPNGNVASELMENLPQFVQPESWTDAAAINCTGSRLVIRQTKSVHSEIEQFIARWIQETAAGDQP